MNDSKIELPAGADFTPDIIKNLPECLCLFASNPDWSVGDCVETISSKYFHTSSSAKARTNNCISSMVSYGLIEKKNGVINLSSFGKQLILVKDNIDSMKTLFAKYLLLELNGHLFISTIRQLNKYSQTVTNSSIYDALQTQGFDVISTGHHIPTMRCWLSWTNILDNKLNINEDLVDTILGTETSEKIDLFEDLSLEQIQFIQVLAGYNTNNDYVNATDILNQTEAKYSNWKNNRSQFQSKIIHPLVEKGLIEIENKEKLNGSRAKIRISQQINNEIILKIANQHALLQEPELLSYCLKPLVELYQNLFISDKYIKGLALEALSINLMSMLNLSFIGTRIKNDYEIDGLFESDELTLNRWQVQCKNNTNSDITVDLIAKEVGLSIDLNSTVILMITTCDVTKNAYNFANRIMKKTNLTILFITGKDLKEIVINPSYLRNCINKQIKKIKENKKNINQ